MKNLNHIATANLINWYNLIVENKNDGEIKDNLIAITNDIESKYEAYIQNFNSTDLINIVDSDYTINHEGLISCYKSEGNTLKNLKKEIKVIQLDELKGLCQYCGILKPKTFDHYLPISLYPEYSCLGINIIPCCKDCNGKKLNYWKEDNERGIVNFYIDNIPNRQFLHGNIIFNEGIPHIEYELLNPNNLIDESFMRIVSKHFKRLQLLELYKEESTNQLSEMIRTFKIYSNNTTLERMRQNLIRDANQLQNQFGINYWKAVMRQSLSESEQFLNYLIENLNE